MEAGPEVRRFTAVTISFAKEADAPVASPERARYRGQNMTQTKD